MTDLLPDEIYVCVRPSEISSRFSTLEVCRDETGMGGWPSGKYIRADLVSTPNKSAEVDLGASLVEKVARSICRAGICGPRSHLDEQEEIHWRKYELEAKAAIKTLAASGHLATGKGGGDHPQIEGLDAAINNSIMYPMVNDVGFQSEHDRRVVMQAARRYLALTADNAKRGE